jgi:hypothetical protein
VVRDGSSGSAVVPSPLGRVGGASVPQLGALSAARRSALLRATAPEALSTAVALETQSTGASYLIGRAVVSVAAVAHPALGTALAGTRSR